MGWQQSFTSILYTGHGKQSPRADGVLIIAPGHGASCRRVDVLRTGLPRHVLVLICVTAVDRSGSNSTVSRWDCVEALLAEHRTRVRAPGAGAGMSHFQHPSVACNIRTKCTGPAISCALAPSLSSAADDLPPSLAQTLRKVVSRHWRFEPRPGELAVAFSLCLGWLRSLCVAAATSDVYL